LLIGDNAEGSGGFAIPQKKAGHLLHGLIINECSLPVVGDVELAI
jgi:hypothetical protein